jgi:ferric iron reductase protein FhuF
VSSVTPATPLAATIARVSTLDQYLAAALGRPEGDGWIEGTEIGLHLGECLRRIGIRCRTVKRRVQAALFMCDYSWRLAAPAVATYLAERRVPDLGPGNVAVRFDGKGVAEPPSFLTAVFAGLPNDSAAGIRCHDDEALRSWLRQRLQEHLAVAISALRKLAPLGPRAQWALAADACASSFLYAGKKLGDQESARREAEAFLAAGGSPLRTRSSFFTLEHAGRKEIFHARASCCLSYKLPEHRYCTTCPLIPREERDRRLREWMEDPTEEE